MKSFNSFHLGPTALWLTMTIVLFGCSIASPSSTSERSSAESMIAKLDAVYDLRSLREFLGTLLKLHPMVEGVEIAHTQIHDEWTVDPSWRPVGLSCGDWVFQESIRGNQEFDLRYRFQPEHAIRFHCKLTSRGNYLVMGIEKEDLASVTDGSIKIK